MKKLEVTHKKVGDNVSQPHEISNVAGEPAATLTNAKVNANPHMGPFTPRDQALTANEVPGRASNQEAATANEATPRMTSERESRLRQTSIKADGSTKPARSGMVEAVQGADQKQLAKLEPDAHAEHRMAHIKERQGHVIASVDVPAHTAEISLGHSAIEGCAVAAAEAWGSIEKAKDDADFAHCTGEWRRHLLNVAESVYTSGVITVGDTTICRFEKAVQKIRARQIKEREAAARAA